MVYQPEVNNNLVTVIYPFTEGSGTHGEVWENGSNMLVGYAVVSPFLSRPLSTVEPGQLKMYLTS